MSLQVHTAQIRYVKANLPDAFDVSRLGAWQARKAGTSLDGEIFAPSWELLKDCKAGLVTQQQYEERYIAEQRASLKENTHVWRWFFQKQRIVVCCYEKYGDFCHRHILREYILPRLGAKDMGEIR